MFYSNEFLDLLIADFNSYIKNGSILPHSTEGRNLISNRSVRSKDMNEAQVRQSFILPLLEILGWNKQNPLEVIAEERANGGYLDIRLSANGKTHFVVEIKRPSVNLDISSSSGKAAGYQGVGYARSFAENPITIVTNFERINIYHSYNIVKESNINSNLLATFLWCELKSPKAQEILKHLTKSSCEQGQDKTFFDNLVPNKEVIRLTKPLNEKILEDFEKWRLGLGQDLFNHGLKDPNVLNILVQKILDKIILIRNVQDRGVDSSGLSNLKQLSIEGEIGKQLKETIFPYFERTLSKDFFKQDSLEKQHLPFISDEIFKSIILKTYGEDSDGVVQDIYDFSIIPVELLGYAYEQYLGKIFLVENGKLKLDLKPELKKSGGVCYTPVFVVDYIVNNALQALSIKNKGETVKRLQGFKFLDPSCGSGSFLIRLFSQLVRSTYSDPTKKSSVSTGPSLKEKVAILQSCIFGVDIDDRAIEITKLSLILKLLEGEVQLSLIGEGLIPDISKNVRIGNSLISPSDLRSGLSIDQKRSMKPLDWEHFLNDISSPNGFTAVIGNPPYVRNQHFTECFPLQAAILQTKYKSFSEGNADIYLSFVERGLEILAPNGILSYIMPHRFWTNDYGSQLRSIIQRSSKLTEVVNFRAEPVFEGVTTYTTIMTLEKRVTKKSYLIDYYECVPFTGAENLIKLISTFKIRSSIDNESLIVDKLSSKILLEQVWLLAPNSIREKVLLLEEKGTPLKNFISEKGIYQGIITGGDDDYFIPVEKWAGELNRFLVRMLKGSKDLKAFEKPESRMLLIYPYVLEDGSCRLAALSEIEDESPELFEILTAREETLRSRNSLKTKKQREEDLENFPSEFKMVDGELVWHYLGEDYYKYARNQALNAPKISKVLVPSLFKRPCFIPDIDGEYITSGSGSGGGGGYIFTVQPEYEADLAVLVGCLSSDYLAIWFERRGDLYQSYYIGADKKILNEAPVLLNLISEDVKEKINGYVTDLFSISDVNDSLYKETLNSLNYEVEKIIKEEA